MPKQAFAKLLYNNPNLDGGDTSEIKTGPTIVPRSESGRHKASLDS